MRSTLRLLETANPGKIFKLPSRGKSWPGPGPWLYAAFHRDDYPAGDGSLAVPSGLREGRVLGNDFAMKEGWNMYMGSSVPGFPAHPHRGMETVTIVNEGTIDHGDSTGSGARYGAGDVQWVTAGKGVKHSEMFPLLNTAEGERNTLDIYQLWLNLAAVDKDADPEFVMMWKEAIPIVNRSGVTVRVVAGNYYGTRGLAPPGRSWAKRSNTDVAAWAIDLEPGAKLMLPPVNFNKAERTVYVHARVPGPQGASEKDKVRVQVDGKWVDDWHALAFERGAGQMLLQNDKVAPARVLVLQAVPIGEPVAVRGPFLMNTEQENLDAFAEYRKTHFGKWPWPSDTPTYGEEPRFANYRGKKRVDPVQKYQQKGKAKAEAEA